MESCTVSFFAAHSWYRAVQGLEIVATVFVLASIVTGLMRVNLGQSIWQTACGASAFSAGRKSNPYILTFNPS